MRCSRFRNHVLRGWLSKGTRTRNTAVAGVESVSLDMPTRNCHNASDAAGCPEPRSLIEESYWVQRRIYKPAILGARRRITCLTFSERSIIATVFNISLFLASFGDRPEIWITRFLDPLVSISILTFWLWRNGRIGTAWDCANRRTGLDFRCRF